MEKYTITGMSCAACSARVEKAVSSLDGVESCSVNLLTNSMMVEGTAKEEDIINAVTDAGYGASKENKKNQKTEKSENSFENESTLIKKRLIFSIIFLIVLMYFSMGKMLFGLEYFGVFKDNPVALGIMQMLLSGIVMLINQKFFISGYKSLRHKAPNMDVLVSMGSLAAFIYSTCVLFAMTDAFMKGNHTLVHTLSHEFYFESAAMILTLITVGKLLEAYSKGKTTNAIKSLIDLAPKTATVIRDGKEVVIKASEIVLGDIFILTPGKSVPADGVVEEGSSSVDESALTGESMPVDKKEGDKIWQATINKAGFLKCRATGVGEETTLSRIIQMVTDAASTKAPISRIADKVSGIFVPVVIVIALVTTLMWLLLGKSIGFSLARGICVLVISCPCALGLATPVAIMVGSGMGAKNGILFKTSAALERTGKAKIIALDKTGTITEGKPRVTDIITDDEAELLKVAYTLEKRSEHPLAKAIKIKCEEEGMKPYEAHDFISLTGSGVKAYMGEELLMGGNIALVSKEITLPPEAVKTAQNLSEEGKTPLLFIKDEKFLGIIAVADTIKEDSAEAVRELKKLGIKTVMITGDNSRTAKAIAKEVGVDDIISDVLPDGKEKAIKNLQNEGVTIMVGDGINDAPALTTADIGIAIGAGTDVAIESADVVLTKSALGDVVTAIKLSRATIRNIHENLFWAFFYNALGIPLAAGVFISTLGWELNPMFGAAAMSLSSFCVVTNALRLNFFKADKKKKEEKQMETVLKIEGMMCPHCEGRVKSALESVNGVTEVIASHEKGTAIVKSEKEIPFDELKKIVEEQGYKVL